MKRFLSLAAAVLLCLMILPLCSIDASAVHNFAKGWNGDTNGSGVIDDYGLFSEDPDTLKDLNQAVRETAEDLEMNILIFLAGSDYMYMTDISTEIFADDNYDEIFGEDTDGVFYYLDISGKSPAYDYISTSGKAVLSYKNNIDSIFSKLDYYLPSSGSTVYSNDIADAIKAFLDCLKEYDSDTSGLTYYHDVSSGKYFYYKGGDLIITTSRPPAKTLLYGAVSAVIGAIVGAISYAIGKSRYKFKNSTDAGVYVSQEKTRYFQNEDTFLREHTSRTRIETDSGGSRGGGGGGHSYSGGHGGGGHHR